MPQRASQPATFCKALRLNLDVLAELQDDFATRVRHQTGEHFVGSARLLQRQHRSYLSGEFAAIEEFGECVQARGNHFHKKESGTDASGLL